MTNVVGYNFVKSTSTNDYPYEWIWTGFLNDKVTATVYDKAENIESKSLKTWNSYNQPRNQQFLDSLFIQILHRLTNII